MAQEIDLSAEVNNDVPYQFTIPAVNGIPFSLTGYTVKVFLKATSTSPDSGATIFLSGTGITLTAPLLGQFTWTLPHASNTTVGTRWYRVDVIDVSSNVTTYFFGKLTVLAS